MAVVNKSAPGLPDLTSAKPVPADVRKNHGRLRSSRFSVAVTNGDSTGSTFEVARLPSHAVVSKMSQIHCSAITGLTDADLGTSDDADALMDGQSLAAAGSFGAASAVTLGNIDLPLWQLVGLDKDPKKELPIILTMNAGATANGTVVVELVYIVD